jgi:hypothetical protein
MQTIRVALTLVCLGGSLTAVLKPLEAVFNQSWTEMPRRFSMEILNDHNVAAGASLVSDCKGQPAKARMAGSGQSREGTQKAEVIAMVQRKDGASLE